MDYFNFIRQMHRAFRVAALTHGMQLDPDASDAEALDILCMYCSSGEL
jgi:hypothetical protein